MDRRLCQQCRLGHVGKELQVVEVVALTAGRVGSLLSRSTSALWRDVESLSIFDRVEKRDVVSDRLIMDM